MLTVGELAGLAGTTVRAVRHYTALGLLAEPPRDASGYRRYAVTDLVRLLRVVALRDVGLPLPRIAVLLAQDETDVRAALDALDEELAAQEAALAERRRRLAALRSAGADPEVPAVFAEAYRTLVAGGVPAEHLRLEKEAMLLAVALASPQDLEQLEAYYAAVVGSGPGGAARMVELEHRIAALTDDQQIEEIAQELAAELRALPGMTGSGLVTTPEDEAARALMEAWLAEQSGPQRRLVERVRELLEEPGRVPFADM